MPDYSFTMTAGDFVGALQGYGGASSPFGPFGAIDAEPISGQTLQLLFTGVGSGGGAIVFDGDVESLVAGKTLWVDGTEYPFAVDWQTDGDATSGVWDDGSGYPTFTDGNSYFIEIKSPGGGPTYGDGALASSGSGALSGVARATAAAALSASGAASASFRPEAAGTLSASGSGALSAVGASHAAAAFAAAGASDLAGVGAYAAVVSAALSSDGAGALAGAGASLALAAVSSGGQGAASFAAKYYSTPVLLAAQGRNVARSGGTDWTNPGNVTAEDATNATRSLVNSSSNWLVADTFGLASYLPSNLEAIVGIEVTVKASETLSDAVLTQVNVGKGDSTLATAKGPQDLTTTLTNYVFGGVGDTWGLSWSRSDVVASTFQARLYASASSVAQANVDAIKVRVHYQLTQDTTAAFAASGTGDLQAAGASIAAAALTSSGAATLAAVGGTVSPAVLTAAGSSDLAATAAPFFSATLTAAGAGSLSALSSAGAGGVLAAAGVATCDFRPAALAAATLTSAGAGAFDAKSGSVITAALAAGGVSTGTFVAQVALQAQGQGIATFAGAPLCNAALVASGIGAITAVGASVAPAQLLSAGVGSMTADARLFATGVLAVAGWSSFVGVIELVPDDEFAASRIRGRRSEISRVAAVRTERVLTAARLEPRPTRVRMQ